MACTIHIIETIGDAKLGIMARPRGGDWLEDELASISQHDFDVVVSLLETEEAEDLELTDEAAACCRLGLEFVDIPIPDRSTPALDSSVMTAISSLASRWGSGKSIVIHCRMAYGRAPMIAACILISRGASAGDAIAKVAAARGVPVPETAEQREWIARYEKTVRCRTHER